jgi:hypothetical protein
MYLFIVVFHFLSGLDCGLGLSNKDVDRGAQLLREGEETCLQKGLVDEIRSLKEWVTHFSNRDQANNQRMDSMAETIENRVESLTERLTSLDSKYNTAYTFLQKKLSEVTDEMKLQYDEFSQNSLYVDILRRSYKSYGGENGILKDRIEKLEKKIEEAEGSTFIRKENEENDDLFSFLKQKKISLPEFGEAQNTLFRSHF